MKRHLGIAAAISNSLHLISVAYAAYNALRIPEPYMAIVFLQSLFDGNSRTKSSMCLRLRGTAEESWDIGTTK